MKHRAHISPLITCSKPPGKHMLEVSYADDVVVKSEAVKGMYDLIDQVSSGERLKKLMLMGEHTTITKEARNLIVHENAIRKNKIIAEAIVVHNFEQKLNANFYMLLSGQQYPIMFFTDKRQAEQWLETYN